MSGVSWPRSRRLPADRAKPTIQIASVNAAPAFEPLTSCSENKRSDAEHSQQRSPQVDDLEPFINLSSITNALLDRRKAPPTKFMLILKELAGTPEWIRTTDLLLRRERVNVYLIDSYSSDEGV
jgi:hypothetical protein